MSYIGGDHTGDGLVMASEDDDAHNLSDASLIEDDDDVESEIPAPDLDDQGSEASSVIDLPGVPVISEAPSEDQEDREVNQHGEDEVASEFHGFSEQDVPRRKVILAPEKAAEILDLTKPFRSDMNDNKSVYGGHLPSYKVTSDPAKVTVSPTAVVKPPPNPLLKSPPLATPIPTTPIPTHPIPTTPSPGKVNRKPNVSSVRESGREWRPSAQFFKPLHAGWVREVIYERAPDGSYAAKPKIVYHAPLVHGTKPRTFRSLAELSSYLSGASATLTLHNFSFRNEPMNAPKGQEVCHAMDEPVDIFPAKPDPPPEPQPPPQPQPQQPKAVSSPSTFSPSGLLKVKMFSKMKEKNAYASESSGNDVNELEEDKEDFDLMEDTSQLGNSGVTITPVNKKPPQLGVGVNIHMPTSSLKRPTPPMTTTESISKRLKLAGASVTPVAKRRPVLRPPNPTNSSCSIHCPNANRFPELSCTSCHALFHPVCVGLSPPPADYSDYDFYCAACQPPPGKENKPFSSPFTASLASVTGTTTLAPSVTLTPATGATKKRSIVGRQSASKTKAPLRPIEAQSVVNIAGMKYLVVPHPEPPGQTVAKKNKPSNVTKLPVLLKPQQHDDMPSFEVEETADGKLLLVPFGQSANATTNPFKSSLGTKESNSKSSSCFANSHFQSNLSGGYYAMLLVFRYLTVQERVVASKVCRLWHQIAKHQSLWATISLKNCRVHNWKSFRDHLNRVGTTKLDMRKVLFVQGPEESWLEVAKHVAAGTTTLKTVDFPRVSTEALHTFVDNAATSPVAQIQGVIAGSITCNSSKTDLVNLEKFANLKGLAELKLKSSSGTLKMANFDHSLGSFVNNAAQTLTRLSLLSLNCLRSHHLLAISQLHQLESLELGNCSTVESFSQFFATLIPLENLASLRLESGTVDNNIGQLANLPKLSQLELIDFQLVPGFAHGFSKLQNLRKLLMIPSYKDEVAAVNSEIVDFTLSLSNLSHFYLGLTNEWLESMNALLSSNESNKDSFPILVNGVCELYTLSKLFKTLSAAMPAAKTVKLLKMSKPSTAKQYIRLMKQ